MRIGIDATALLNRISDVAPATQVHTDVARLRLLAHGTWPPELKLVGLADGGYPCPIAIVAPASAQDVAAILREANATGFKVVAVAGGSGIVGGSVPGPTTLLLDLRRLDAIAIDRRGYRVVCGPGVTIAALDEALGREGLTSGHSPQSRASATVGGMAATNGAGQLSGRYGKFDEMVLALQVALADGRLLRLPLDIRGSTGPALRRLFIGSEGTLGVITEATLRAWPAPSSRQLTGFWFRGTGRGLQVLEELLTRGVSPALVRLYDDEASKSFADEIGVPAAEFDSLLIVGAEGEPEIVAGELAAVRRVCRTAEAVEVGRNAADAWLARRFDTGGILATIQRPGGIADAIEVSAPWDRIATVWTAMRAAAAPLAERVECHFSHVYQEGASVYVIVHAEAPDDRAALALYRQLLAALLDASLANGGNVSHHHGIGTAKAAWLQRQLGPAYELLDTLKVALDGRHTLNTGVLGLGPSPLLGTRLATATDVVGLNRESA